MRRPPARELAARRALWARACDHFGYTPAQLARMTPAQVRQILFHPRDARGSVAAPEASAPEVTLEKHLGMVRAAAAQMNRRRPGAVSPEMLQAKLDEVRARYESGTKGGD